ncbi:laminin subunit alpha-1 [Dermochelys coriacea]|uniref:laminin subunit alpha-1 n=1 Tax=Dermochelys coriacea TaxID=27794 RepID=UPI0018E8BBFD|nr:laminin subunit alpha-1 [Dermochelys coriacea]
MSRGEMPSRCSCRWLLLASLLWAAGECQLRGLFPAILNLASHAHINTNATCGEKGPEMFCKLVEHVPGRPLRNAQCRVCDHNSANPKEQHPISNAIDGTNNWWQSPSIQNGREYHWVTITLDLRQVFQVAYVIIKAANAPRPGNWILERSVDGTEFKPWQYYAISDTECLTRYNVTPRLGPPTYKRDDEVICTSYYSRLVPLEHGEIHTSLINGRPSADDPSQTLLEFTSARYIRLRLQRIRTLNADLMTLSHHDPKDLDPIVTRRYYYSIKDISVGGMCICYGHARSCPLDETTKKLQCQCEHNTCGESCNECCPGYHQNPWRPGTISAGNKCEKCNCHNKAEDCYYNQAVADQNRSINIHGQFLGGGVCINCTQHTTGINCEICADGYYRPYKVSPYEDNPCHPCDCDPFGSLSSDCIKDDDHSNLQHGTQPGQCQCKEGYTGEKCDRCAFGYKGYPSCVHCNCSLVGSINDDPCTEPCLCKENVDGENCDRCKPGFYNLQERNPQGCTECFCFGVSDVCDSLAWPISQVSDMAGWLVTDLYTEKRVEPQQGQFAGPHQISVNNTAAVKILKSTYYWSAPEPYLGNKLTAFGGYLKYTVSYDIPMESVDSDMVSNVDVIIQGSGQILSTRSEGLSLQPYEEYSNAVKLVSENLIDFNTKKAIDRDRLMTVLANVTHLLIRANYNIAKRAIYRLDSVTLDTANANAIDLSSAAEVEQCECPQGYTGISCESCLSGYYRVGGILFGGICQPCECNGHATECDIHGVCFACQHNTTGLSCNQCLPGFYGTPSRGMPEDCQPCACPLRTDTNNFSPTCHMDNRGEVICDKCLPGYAGSRCERCANGYYGNPVVPGESCVPCDCNGNIDPAEDGHCDALTGECLKCVRNTQGHHCEKCADGYYGDAVIAKNCHVCECHVNSSLSNICHRETGQCHCKPNVIGPRCDTCVNGYYGLNTGFGCLPCNCSQYGSVSEDCNDEGQCHCVPGVAGEKCDHCAHGFYAFQDSGCSSCDCAHTQNNCNEDSGQCICPPHTQGPKCELCEDNYWGLDHEHGCMACDCSDVGSTSLQCDLQTGQCQCKDEFGGEDCSKCALGYRDYPDCVFCDCDLSGTKADKCDESQGVCSCEEETGICACKENVFGFHCSECKTGTFALRASNPLGCTPCFCFGLSEFCSELEDHVRIPVTLTPDQSILHVVSQSNLSGTVEGVFSQFSDVLLDATTVREHLKTEPFYWRLPDQFQGDQLKAYGGKLKYIVAFYALDGFGTSNFEPQILIKGGRTSKLVIYVDISAPRNGVRSEEEVEMKEHVWKYFNSVSDQSVTRSDFMSVLSNVEYILIKASYGQGLQQSRIANISMEIAVKAEEMHLGRETAHLIEQCECPTGYAGLSCQSCASGYYRVKHVDLNVKEPRQMTAPCVPCQCNNHSETCNLETGKCLNCRDNTAGEHCSVCAPGYYGKVIGSVNDCSLCACPRTNLTSFSPTCVLKDGHDFHCDACLIGYEGQYCERCSLGYYGNPEMPGGSCQQCQCNPSGSIHNNCNPISGQCLCKQGVTGQLCDACEPRHILVENECVSCNDDCTGVLLNDLDHFDKAIFSINFTGVTFAPYGILADVENVTKYLKGSLLSREDPIYSLEMAKEGLVNISGGTDQLHKEFTRILERGWQLNNATQRTMNESRHLTVFIDTMYTTIKVLAEVATSLNETLALDFQLSNSTSQSLQEDISTMLEAMRRRHFMHQDQNVTTVLNTAERLLLRVQKEYLKPQQKLVELKKSASLLLTNHNIRLQEAQDLVNEACTNTNETNRLLFLIYSNLAELNDKKLNIQENKDLSIMLIKEGKVLMDVAAALATDVKNSTSNLEIHRDGLVLWNAKLRHHVDDLVMQMSMRGALDLVYRAEDHAAEFQKLAEVLDSGLSNVRNVSLNATNDVHAHSSITSLIERTENLADDASRVITNPLESPEESLDSLGKEALQLSSKFLNETKNLKRKNEGLESRLNRLKKKVEKIQESAHKITNQLNDSRLALRALPNDTSDTFFEAKELAVSANTSAVAGLSHIVDFNQKLLNTSSELSKVNEMLRKTNELIMDSSKAAASAERQVKEVEAQANLLFDRLKPLKMLEENLSRNLSEIKELISQARKQAASIKVAISADRDCIRAYSPQISSTNYNILTLNVKTAEPDNLLFYLGSSGNSDFMAVEMLRGKVAFLWDVGSGATRLEYPNFQIDNNKWHRIHITRFGKTGTLSIEDTSSNQKSLSKTATAPGTATVLDVNKSTLIFVGGLGGQIKKSPAVKVTHFKGCMGEASLNGKSIGLWNYIKREGACNGCFGSPQDEDTSFHFDGSGYSVVERALRSTVTQIIMFFSTFSPNGLLLYLASNGTRDFLSLELMDGKVRLTVDLGSGPLMLKTENRYNNGTWYKISFSRNKKQGVLAVMDAYNLHYKETKQGESPGVASDLNRSDKDPIYIGGLPRSRAVRKGLNSRTYVGCIKNLEISRSTFDLLKNSYGVRKGCILEPIRSVSILNDGYIELLPKSLSPESELMVTFATKNSSGIILAGLSKGMEKRRRRQAHLPFFSIMLIDGHLAVHINAGDRASTRKIILQPANGTYSDGQEHSVILIRNKRMITVQVDESNPAELRLGLSAEMSPMNISNFYAGGVPAGEGISGFKMTGSFYGCIRNLIFNMQLLDFTTAVRYEHVDMDSCLLSEKPKPAIQAEDIEIQPELQPLPIPLQPLTEIKRVHTTNLVHAAPVGKGQCAQDSIPDHVPGAHQFGLAKGSHIILLFNQSTVRRKLSVQLNLRTYASSGLIYYLAHQNQIDYAALQLHGGQLYFLFDLGKGKAVAFHPAAISDGKWHTVKTEYVKRKGIITVDGQESEAVNALGDGNTLDVEGKLYLGGLPLDYTARNTGNVTHSIPACIGSVMINNKQLDKESPVSILAVNKCYATAQEGTFFDGSGFAALVKEGYKVRSDVNVTFEFRTMAMNGVLLGISSAKVDAIGLEIVNGKVLFHVNNGAGRITATYEPRGANSLCDGKWHKLQANKSKHRIALMIDGNLVQADNPHIQSTSADTNNPIYVGGFPADMKQNCLTSKSSFHGCLRNLKLIKGQLVESYDFSEAFDLHGVFPHSCPGSEH